MQQLSDGFAGLRLPKSLNVPGGYHVSVDSKKLKNRLSRCFIEMSHGIQEGVLSDGVVI